ncbi:hypothetical protein O181_109475 [Austropuccinia psidii MF-1]|uniref:Retroviral polymerase SH3-like domain-containing protein n=1 Tax=Austropuccinia psidii MF-1 TaxID=1389203 RepID=A0A9Q3JUH0_9BASI|nr:hypothetical protein [Austropuccinia psidii MF-1]
MTPYEIWHKSKPPLNKLKPFGCKAWLKIPKHQISNKFGSKAWDGIFRGYKNEASSYRILRTSDQKIIISKHVLFDEEKFPSLTSQEQNIDEAYDFFPGSIQDMEKNLPDSTDINENNPRIKSLSSEDEEEDIFIDAFKQQPQRIRVIGSRDPTLISSEINSENILPFS